MKGERCNTFHFFPSFARITTGNSRVMKRSICSLLAAFGFFSACLFSAQRVEAVLGESAGSVESDRTALSASRLAVTGGNGYAVHEIVSDSVTVREYVSNSGVVFAVVWKGMVHPDLTRLLGSYASEYHETLQQMPRQKGSRRFQVKTPSIVVQKWGHMRSLQGRAYVPALIPAGVSVDEIR